MNDATGYLQVPIEAAKQLATECWRLRTLANSSALLEDDQVALERSVKRMSEALVSIGIRITDLRGTAYDPGMVPEVLEVQADPTLSEGESMIDETILPTLTWNGNIIQIGQIVVKQAALAKASSKEHNGLDC